MSVLGGEVSRCSVFAVLLAAPIVGCSEVPAPEPTIRHDVSTAAPSSSAPSASASAAPSDFVPSKITLVEKAMGTSIHIQSFTTPALGEAALKQRMLGAFKEIQRLEALMTTWRDSEITRVNAAAGKDAVVVGPESFAVVDKSLWIAGLSEGVFDISFESMHGVWKFDQDLTKKVPSQASIDEARAHVNWKNIAVDASARSIKLVDPKMKISLGGIAKGYAVDAAARFLSEQGVTAYYVQAGGDLFIRGRKPDGEPFQVGVRDPRGKSEEDTFAALPVEDHAFSTAGDYERYFLLDGKRYHHIIDPRTGYPATASRCVTVWAKDAFTADAIDDAVFILGPEKGLALVESLDGVGAVIVDKDNKVWVSKRLEPLIKKWREPSDGL